MVRSLGMTSLVGYASLAPVSVTIEIEGPSAEGKVGIRCHGERSVNYIRLLWMGTVPADFLGGRLRR